MKPNFFVLCWMSTFILASCKDRGGSGSELQNAADTPFSSVENLALEIRLGATPRFNIGSSKGGARGAQDESVNVVYGILSRISKAYNENRPLEVCSVKGRFSPVLVDDSHCSSAPNVNDDITRSVGTGVANVGGSFVKVKFVSMQIAFTINGYTSIPRLQVWADTDVSVNQGRYSFASSDSKSQILLSELATKLRSAYPNRHSSIDLCIKNQTILPDSSCQ